MREGVAGPEAFLYLVPLWLGYVVLGHFLFKPPRDIAFKRKWFPAYNGGIGPLFWASLILIGAAPMGVAVFLVPIAAITWLTIRNTHVCAHCGATTYDKSLRFSAARFCSRCGAPLT